MNGAQTKKFLDALEAAEMTKYEFDSDLGTHIYNDGENAFVKYVEASRSSRLCSAMRRRRPLLSR